MTSKEDEAGKRVAGPRAWDLVKEIRTRYIDGAPYWACETDGVHGRISASAIQHAHEHPGHQINLWVSVKKEAAR